jgi:hypothetical protein
VGTVWDEEEARGRQLMVLLHLALGQATEALVHSTAALRLAETWPALPESILFVHARALRAAGRAAEASDFLTRAHRLVQHVAEQIPSPALRQSWLQDVWVNREIAQDWAASQS